MGICPNYKNKEVITSFNKIIEAFGGKPMTEDEFKDSALRNQRTGLDLTAMEIAYELWSQNNGFSLDYTPFTDKDGNPVKSKLFSDLLDLFDGDYTSAVIAKSKVYTNEFINWFGDWINNPESASKVLDENGEPLIVYHGTLAEFDTFNISKLGETTGKGYYIDHITGEKIPLDSASAFFFTNNRSAAISYKNLSINNKNEITAVFYDNLASIFSNRTKGHWTTLKENKLNLAEFIDNVLSPIIGFDVRREANKIIDGTSTLSEDFKLKYAEKFSAMANKIKNLPDARSISNLYNNLQLKKNNLDFIIKNKDQILNNTKLNYFDEYVMSFISGYGNSLKGDVYVIISYDEYKYKAVGIPGTSGYVDITKDNFDLLLAEINKSIQQNENDLNEDTQKGHYDNGNILGVFLNIKNPLSNDYKESAFPDKYKNGEYDTAYVAARQVKKARQDGNDGVIYNNVIDPFLMDSYGIFDPNQVKSATDNVGTFSTTDDNIYHQNVLLAAMEYVASTPQEYFGNKIFKQLKDGNVVSSQQVVQAMIDNGIYDTTNTELSKLLAMHDIPVRFGELGINTLAATITDNNGGSIIIINPNLIGLVSSNFMSTTMLHEIVHAITVDAINNPKTEEERRFAKANHKLYQILNSTLDPKLYSRNDVQRGYYALTNEKEFAAAFMTDEVTRAAMFDAMYKLDGALQNKFITRLKNFINAITDVIVNKQFFKNNVQQLLEYQRILNDYINNASPIKNGNILDISDLKEFAKNIDRNALMLDYAIRAQNRLNFLLKYYESNNQNINNRFDGVIQSLNTRLLALKNSILSEDRKAEEYLATQNAIYMLDSSYVSNFVAIKNITDSISALVLRDIDDLKSKVTQTGDISFEEYMYHMHSNFGTWAGILQEFDLIYKNPLNVQQLITEANSMLQDGDAKITQEDVINMLDTVKRVKNMCTDQMNTLQLIRQNKVKESLKFIGQTVNANDMDNFVESLYEQIPSLEDIKTITRNFASADAVDVPGIRALTYLVSKANDAAEELAQDKAIELYNLQRQIKDKESIQLLYETLDNGLASGYLTRSLNYGKFYNEYDKKLILINRDIAKKYDIPIEDSNRVAPEQEDARLEWNQMREEWLSTHCERKYVPEYYKAWAKVSQSTKDLLLSITTMIKSISQRMYEGADGKMHSIIDQKGIPHYEYLSDEDWEKLNDLIIKKNRLRSLYDINGVKKVGSALLTALELQQLYNDLYKEQGSGNREKKVTEWANARLDMVYDCGGQSIVEQFGGGEQFIKYLCGEDSSFDYSGFENAINDPNSNFEKSRFDRWDDRNSRLEFKTDEDGNGIIFNQIEKATGGIKPNYGEEYDALNKELKEKLNVYYGKSGYIKGTKIPNSLKKDLREILKKMNKIKKDKLNSDKSLLAVSKAYGKVFDLYIKFTDTQEYKEAKSKLAKSVDGNFDLYNILLGQFGVTDYRLGIPITRPYRWFQRMEAKDKHTYMHYVPGDAWVDPDSGTKFDNINFDETQNTSMVPKREFYDNSAKFNQIMRNPQLKALYEAAHETIKVSNAKLSNRLYADNYMLPQVVGNVFDRMRGHNWFKEDKENGVGNKFSVMWQAFKEMLGFRGENDDELFGSEWNLNNYDESGRATNTANRKIYASTMPDGSPYRALPQYYTKKMKDTGQISRHLVSILLSYYHMSCAFEEKAKIKAQVDTILEDIKSMVLKSGNDIVGGEHNSESNVYLMARNYVDFDFYNIKMNDTSSKDDKFSYTKFSSTFLRYTTSRNLGLNPKVAMTGFLTSFCAHLINSLVGYKYTHGDAARGTMDVIENILGIMSNAGTHYATNKIVLLAEEFNISDQFDKKISDSGYGRLRYLMYNHSIFGMLSSMDFISKASIMCSVLHSYRYVDGEFVTKGDLKLQKYRGEEWYERKKDAWYKAKDKSLFDVLNKNKQGSGIECNEEYKAAYEKVKYIVKKRCIKFAEHADGMATRTQKAQILRSWFGGLILLHRQYLPMMIQERFGESVYDYDVQQYKGGQFRRLYRFFMEMAMHNALTAAASGAALTSIIASSPAAIIAGAAIANGVRMFNKSKQKLSTELNNKTLKLKFDSYFRDYSSKEANTETQLNRNALRQLTLEVLAYKMAICPVVGTICMWADADPDNTWKQMMAYWFRGLLWEFYTPYRFDDILNNIKSPSAATGLLDDIQNVINASLNTANPMFYEMEYFLMSLLGWSSFENLNEFEEDLYVNKRDKVYGGSSKLYKYGVKATPARNILEQSIDSKSKRKYFENQIMGKDNLEGWIDSDTLYNLIF